MEIVYIRVESGRKSGVMDISGEIPNAQLCPYCGRISQVYFSRPRKWDGAFTRRRVCDNCGIEFETIEVATGYIKKRKNFKKVQM